MTGDKTLCLCRSEQRNTSICLLFLFLECTLLFLSPIDHICISGGLPSHLAFDFIAMQDHDNSAPSKLVDNFYPSRYLLHYFGQDYTETARRSFDLEF
jgi:hypothetical protein